jgi:Fic family protein
MRRTGTYVRTTVAGTELQAFVPEPLPPARPPLKLDAETTRRLAAAERGLARLDLAAEMLSSLEWFLYGFLRKEAVLSSQIEGTQATLADLLTWEATGEGDESRPPDIEEVSNYLVALKWARKQITRTDALPISTRLLSGAHARLMRGSNRQPGEIRRSQNWIGGRTPAEARFVPPPPDRIADSLTSLERYIHAASDLPPLVRAGLIHVQFETIHPYLDGNGRIGRLLIALLLEEWGLLQRPLLYLSLHFKQHRGEYYRRLDAVRAEGDWEGWIGFFLEAITVVSEDAVTSARDLFRIVEEDRRALLNRSGASLMTIRLLEALPQSPILTIASVVDLLATSKPTATKAIETLADAGILAETTGRKRDRVWRYVRYVDRLSRGTEL